MVLQIILLFFIVNADYGYIYGIQIQVSVYQLAWTIMALNYFQIFIFNVVALILLFNLGKEKLCKSSKVTNAQKSKKKGKKNPIVNKNDESYETINIETNSMNNIDFNNKL